MSEELRPLPCPFCGGEAVLHDHTIIGHDAITTYHVTCPHCHITQMGGTTKERAIAAWNTRTATTDRDFNHAVHDGRLWSVVEECGMYDEETYCIEEWEVQG